MENTRKTIKGFKPETIAKIIASLVLLVKLYTAKLEKGEFVKLVISEGNRKIGRCMNVSLAPILTCGNCKECKYFCYDVKACLQYENVRIARAKNTALFKYSREEFFRQLWERMEHKKTNKFLRFHVSGEIMDVNHFEWIVETARRFPDFKIWTYTKMYTVINQYISEHGGKKSCIPSNLSVMMSEWKGLPIDNPYNLPVFRCVFEGEDKPKKCFECKGNCDFCKEHNCGCVNRQSAYVHLH